MKMLLRIACWVLVAAAIVWWWPAPAGFAGRWVPMPAPLSWDTISKARKASARPSFCAYPSPKCRVG
jgi:hypothetical protein